jgi:hypothetical protein
MMMMMMMMMINDDDDCKGNTFLIMTRKSSVVNYEL